MTRTPLQEMEMLERVRVVAFFPGRINMADEIKFAGWLADTDLGCGRWPGDSLQ
jgi:hypothetical protein